MLINRLFHPLPLAMGWRYARAKRSNGFVSFIALFSTAGIAIGIAALVVVVSIMNGFEQQLKERMLGVIPQVMLSAAHGAINLDTVPLDRLSHLPQVTRVAPFVVTEGIAQSSQQLMAVQVQGMALDPLHPEQDFPFPLIQGSLARFQAKRYQIILGEGISHRLNVGVGDEIRLMVTEGSRFTPLGRMPAQRLFTVAGIFALGADVDHQVAVIRLADSQGLLRLPPQQVNRIRLWLTDAFRSDEVIAHAPPPGLIWQDWRQERGELFQAVAMEKRLMSLMLILIITVACFNILSALVMTVAEKHREIAILRTLGMTSTQIIGVFLVLGGSSGVLGALGGIGGGIALCYGLNPALAALGINLYQAAGGSELPLLIDGGQLAVMFSGAISLSLAATFYPAWQAAQVDPAIALRYE